MTQPQWSAVDRYITELLVPSDPALDSAAAAGKAHVSRTQGKLLHLLARIQGARNVLELGTLGGYSTIWLARALPPGGCLVTLEDDPAHAEAARANIERANLTDVVEVRVGRAVDTLAELAADGRGPFDLVFIDADKESNAEYLRWALELSRPGTLIVADNIVRGGAVAEPSDGDPRVQGVRRFFELLAAEPRLTATAIQTVGSKGYDGFALAVVTR